MQKKISINMVDDELKSIEVDGVEYASPAEIPDPEDRARVEALLSAPDTDSDDDPEDDFDEAEFDKNFAAMGQETSKLPTLIASIFLAVAVILLAIAAFSAYQSARTLATEKSAPGQVVDLLERRSVDSQTNEATTYSYPVVEFRASGETRLRVELSEGSSPPAYQTGDAVTILYDPQQPRHARIQSTASTILLWLVPAITGFIGLVFLTIAVFIFRANRPRKPAQDSLNFKPE